MQKWYNCCATEREGNMNDYTFGNFLYTLRNEKGLSQAQLGEMLGVTNKAVSKWENGSAKPNTSLIPKIAEIFGVTVEELFACKRLEKDSEFEKIKQYLSSQKRKYAILSSAFLSAIIILPLFLIEFICVVMGFNLPDDILAPVGAVGIIFAFVISITAFIIYNNNFKKTITPSDISFSSTFANRLNKGFTISAVAWLSLFLLCFAIYFFILRFSLTAYAANIFISVVAAVLILLLGVFICLANVKRLLKIEFNNNTEKKKIKFSELSKGLKIWYVTICVLLPIVINVRISSFFNNELIPISILLTVLYFVGVLVFLKFASRKK